MLRLIVSRLAQGVAVVALVATFSFVLVHVAPGDPFSAGLTDPGLGPEAVARERARWGYDQPLPVQYGRWIANIARGDLGYSVMRSRPVSQVLRETVPNTLVLMSIALGIGLVGGVALGTWQAARQGTTAERASNAIVIGVLSVPEFLLALGALGLFAAGLRWFPVGRLVDPAMHDSLGFVGRTADILWHLVLPAGLLALTFVAAISRYHRTAMLGVLPDEFIRTARAKGARERLVLVRHALRNALGPVIAIAGLLLPALLGGAVFVEKIFNLPGMGLTLVDAVGRRDYPLVLSGILVSCVMVSVGGALADVLAFAADPRIRRAH